MSPLLSSRHLQGHSPTSTPHLRAILCSSPSYAGTRAGGVLPSQNQEGDMHASHPPPAGASWRAESCQPPETMQSWPPFLLLGGSHRGDALGQHEQLAAILGSRIVLGPGFGTPGRQSCQRKYKCANTCGVWAFKGKQVTPELILSAKIHRMWPLSSSRSEALGGEEGAWRRQVAPGGPSVAVSWCMPCAPGSSDSPSYSVSATSFQLPSGCYVSCSPKRGHYGSLLHSVSLMS